MTPDDCALDPGFFVDREQTALHRLARANYANLSGVGAALYPGRWNRAGIEAIYTSTEIGVPVLERLVHTPQGQIPSNLAMMEIGVSGHWQRERLTLSSYVGLVDPRTSARVAIFPALEMAKRYFSLFEFGGVSDRVFAVAVPSVIVPVWNVVLYPQARGFRDQVSLQSVEPFEFDPRLFPEGTPVEASR